MPSVKDIVVRKPTAAEASRCKSWPTWGCEASQFDWDYDEKETCLILEGQVTVCDRPGQNSITFGPGDFVVFPQGLSCVWKVTQPVRKHYNFG